MNDEINGDLGYVPIVVALAVIVIGVCRRIKQLSPIQRRDEDG